MERALSMDSLSCLKSVGSADLMDTSKADFDVMGDLGELLEPLPYLENEESKDTSETKSSIMDKASESSPVKEELLLKSAPVDASSDPDNKPSKNKGKRKRQNKSKNNKSKSKKRKAAKISTSEQPRVVSPPRNKTEQQVDIQKKNTVSLPRPPVQVPEVVARLMAYMFYTEPYRHHFPKADAIVRDCHYQHTLGKPKYKNLPGIIFEQLLVFLGAAQFNEMYQQSQSFELAPHPCSVRPTVEAAPPSEVHLGIAYGIHLARLEQKEKQKKDKSKEDKSKEVDGEEGSSTRESSKSPPALQAIQKGAVTLETMGEEERQGLWQFLMAQKY